MRTLDYTTCGTCARSIHVELAGHVVRSVSFSGGCSGNTQGICRLVEGMDAEEVVRRLKGVLCRGKTTSCPDQLALALEEALEEDASRHGNS